MIEIILIGILVVSGVYFLGGIIRFFFFNRKRKSLKVIFSEFYYLNHIAGVIAIAVVVLIWKIIAYII